MTFGILKERNDYLKMKHFLHYHSHSEHRIKANGTLAQNGGGELFQFGLKAARAGLV